LSQNPNYQNLLTKVKEVEQQIAAASADLQPDNPQMQSLLERRQNLSILLSQESQRLLRDSGGKDNKVLSFQNPLRLSMIEKLIETNNGLQMLQIREQQLIQAQRALEQQAQRFPGVARQYTDLKQQLELANRTLNQLLTQRESLRVQAAQREFPWELISAPTILADATGAPLPTYGKATRNILLGTTGGLFLGLALALLLERKRNVFASVEDVQEVQELPLLGAIPFHQPLGRFGRFADTVLLQPEAEISRQEQQADFISSCDYLFTNLSFQYTDPPIRAVAVCGVEPGDGQSTIALHLARTAASMGQRVLLVDANWQKPSLHEYLQVDNLVGLSDMLVNDTNKAMIQPAPGIDNLYVLPFGEMPLNNGRLIASPRMMRLVEKLQSSFDFVVFDTPPLGAAMETNFLAAQTDGVILVLAVGKTKCTMANQITQQLKTFKIPCLGIVANNVGQSSNSDEGNEDLETLQNGFAGLMHQENHESFRERVS
jgi:capsular exopolysaccharide synthesis family protein